MPESDLLSDPFGIGPHWLESDGLGGSSTSDDVQLGNTNDLEGDPNPQSTTVVVNVAPQSATFAALNTSKDEGASGVVGEAQGGPGSAGVVGASPFWGVAGVSIALDSFVPARSLQASNASIFPGNTGVFGAGDTIGVCGQSFPGKKAQVPEPLSLYSDATTLCGPTGVFGVGTGTGVFGQGGIGVFGRGNTGVLGRGMIRGGTFEVEPANRNEFANIQLAPVNCQIGNPSDVNGYIPNSTIPVLPGQGRVGDMVLLRPIGQGDPNSRRVQLWLCIETHTELISAQWARIQLEITAPF